MKIQKQLFERITGKVAERKNAFDYLKREGYSTISSGPARTRSGEPTFDTTRFVIKAERVCPDFALYHAGHGPETTLRVKITDSV